MAETSEAFSFLFEIRRWDFLKHLAVWIGELSNEKNPGCLGFTRDYTTQLLRDYHRPL